MEAIKSTPQHVEVNAPLNLELKVSEQADYKTFDNKTVSSKMP